jgi:hypothetical protein
LSLIITLLFSMYSYGGALSLSSMYPSLLPFQQAGNEPMTVDSAPADLEFLEYANGVLPSNQLTCSAEVLSQTVRSSAQNYGREDLRETWYRNSGVIAHYQNMLAASPCFSVLMGDYYRRIKDSESKPSRSSEDTVNRRPALNARAGMGSYANTPPGTYHELALEITGGDPALAMELIGYCGHDDQNQNDYTIISFENESSKNTILSYMQRGAAAQADLVGNEIAESMFEMTYLDEINEVRQGTTSRLEIKCPKHDSAFYAPGAIHSELALPANTVEEIAAVQAPSMGAGVLPAKNYHLTFSATIGCRLAQCGVSQERAQSLMAFVAKKYRARRLKQTQRKYMRWKGLIESEFDIRWGDNIVMSEEFGERVSNWMRENQEEIKEVVGQEFFTTNRARITWEMLRKSIDTSIVFQPSMIDRYLDGETENFMGRRNAFMRNCGRALSRPRCEAGLEHAKTWLMDFKWSQQQQRIGAGFGHGQCENTERLNYEDIEQRACRLLDQRHSQYRCTEFIP